MYINPIKITEKQQVSWETVVCGQRVEHILKKYNAEK